MWWPDGSSDVARIGILTPHLDPVPETELQAMAPAGVSIHAARAPLGMVGPDGKIIPRVDAEIARRFSEPPAVDDATALLSAVSPDAIIYAFTSSSYILGAEADYALRERLEIRSGHIPVIIQCEALVSALNELRAQRVALVHPPWFTAELDALGAAYFDHAGFSISYHGVATLLSDFGDPDKRKIFEWAVEHTPDEADVLVIGGGGFRASGVIEALEAALGRPVLTANQASFWCALKNSNATVSVDHYGQIFSVL
jgi:maleate isomerase